MLKILVPVDGSSNSLHAVRHIVNEFMKIAALEIHLLNVQTPFSHYVSRFVSSRDRHEFHLDQAEPALLPSRQMLARFGVPYVVAMSRVSGNQEERMHRLSTKGNGATSHHEQRLCYEW